MHELTATKTWTQSRSLSEINNSAKEVTEFLNYTPVTKEGEKKKKRPVVQLHRIQISPDHHYPMRKHWYPCGRGLFQDSPTPTPSTQGLTKCFEDENDLIMIRVDLHTHQIIIITTTTHHFKKQREYLSEAQCSSLQMCDESMPRITDVMVVWEGWTNN